VDFEEALERFGFYESKGRVPGGVRLFTAAPNRYLTYSVQAYEDGSALFSWEFALGEYLLTKGIQVAPTKRSISSLIPAWTREADRMACGSPA
jgi:hypothetical protein